MMVGRGFCWALVLCAACGGADPQHGEQAEGDPASSPGAPSSALPADGARAVEAAPDAAQAPPSADPDAWRELFRSELVEELPPPSSASLAARGETDEARLKAILDADMRGDRVYVKNLRGRLSLRPDLVEVRLELGEFYYQSGLPNLAELEFLTLLEADDHQGIAHKLLVDIYRQASDHGRAAWHARRAHRELPEDPTVLFLWGWSLRDAGDLEVATQLAERGLAIDAEDDRVLVLLAMLRADDGRYEEAVDLARRGIAENPDHLRGHLVLGQALLALGQEDEGEQQLQTHRRLLLLNSAKLLNRNPPLEEWERAAALAHYHQLVGRLDLAREELARSEAILPGNPAARVIEARIAVSQGQELVAKELLEAVLVDHPGDSRAARALANLLVIAEDESLRDEQRALELARPLLSKGGDRDYEVLFTLGLAEARLGQTILAKRHLRDALAIEPTNPFALEALAELD